MQIVSQSATLSYSPNPTVPLLMAPPPRKQLCAPIIAGLLPARVAHQPRIEIVFDKPPSHEELLRQLGPIQTREEMNAEIAEIALEAMDYLGGIRAKINASRGRRYEQR
jgi:hypothetical protein